MAGEVYFYQLMHSATEDALQALLPRALQAGWRVAVRGRTEEHLARLDQRLWQGREEDFLPHGLASKPHAALQPVLLTTGVPVNDPQCLMSVEGAELAPDEIAPMARACIFFDGMHPEATAHARQQWKSLTAAGCKAVYWSEESGRWEKKAESKGA